MAQDYFGEEPPAGWRVALAEVLAIGVWMATLFALLVFAYGLAG